MYAPRPNAADAVASATRSTAPRSGRPYLVAAAVLAVVHQAGVAMTVQLLESAPLLLVAMSPIGRHLLLTAPITAIVPFTLVAAGRRALGSAVGYQLGKAYGIQAIAGLAQRAPRLARWVRAFERMFQRADMLVSFLVPRGSALIAGAAGMPFALYLALSTAGHAFWAVVTYKVGDALSDYITPLLAYMQANKQEMTALFLLLVAGQLVYHRLRSQRTRGGTEKAALDKGLTEH